MCLDRLLLPYIPAVFMTSLSDKGCWPQNGSLCRFGGLSSIDLLIKKGARNQVKSYCDFLLLFCFSFLLLLLKKEQI